VAGRYLHYQCYQEMEMGIQCQEMVLVYSLLGKVWDFVILGMVFEIEILGTVWELYFGKELE
jgi:hypothetical protein